MNERKMKRKNFARIAHPFQLPPELERNEGRHVVEKYKRALFSQQNTSFNLKQELRKLAIGRYCWLSCYI
jgi:hypothetical protein